MQCARFAGRSGIYPDLPGFAAEDIDVRSAASEAGIKKGLPRKGRGHMKSYYYITKMEEGCQEKRKEGP